jgi:hypothetical protein
MLRKNTTTKTFKSIEIYLTIDVITENQNAFNNIHKIPCISFESFDLIFFIIYKILQNNIYENKKRQFNNY